MPHMDDMHDLPPRDIKSFRKWRVRKYEEQKRHEMEGLLPPKPIAPPKRPVRLKEKVRSQKDFPLIGSRHRSRGRGNVEALEE